MIGQAGKPIPVTEWTLRYEGYSPGEEGLREALCTVGNGYIAARGQGSYPPVRVGCRGRLRDLVPGQSLEFSL